MCKVSVNTLDDIVNCQLTVVNIFFSANIDQTKLFFDIWCPLALKTDKIMRHRINLKANNQIEYGSKGLGTKNKILAPILHSLHALHPSIQSKYDDEVAEYEKLLNESKDLQIPLLIEIEKNISYSLKAI